MTFRRPIQNGLLVNWEAEKEIWDQTFINKSAPLYCDPSETNLILAEASTGLSTLQSNCDQMIFEEFEFNAYRRFSGSALNAWNDTRSAFDDPSLPNSTSDFPLPHTTPAEGLLVIDTGYSHTTCTPLYKGLPIQQAVKRLDIGGKFMTNYLKDILSLRQLDVRQETYIVNRLKESTCFVSTDFRRDMERSRLPPGAADGMALDYVMPDFTENSEGLVKEHDPRDRKSMAAFGHVRREDGSTEAVLSVGNERFTPTELIFRPENVGMRRAGVAEMVMQCLEKVPTGLWAVMLANVWVIGGGARMPGFKERM